VRAMDSSTNLEALAANIVDKCKLIHLSKVAQSRTAIPTSSCDGVVQNSNQFGQAPLIGARKSRTLKPPLLP
jgi:hypothetical protein